MTVRACSSTSTTLAVGATWPLVVDVRDSNGVLVDAAPVVTVTLPAGSTVVPTVETVTTGVYRAVYVVGTVGRYVARAVSASYGVADFAAFVEATTAATGMPVVDDWRDYDPDDGGSWTDDEIGGALAAEGAAQRSVCRVGAVYPDDLRQALLRRISRNLAMRKLPLAVLTGDAEVATRITTWDAEVRRLEGPHRKLVVG